MALISSSSTAATTAAHPLLRFPTLSHSPSSLFSFSLKNTSLSLSSITTATSSNAIHRRKRSTSFIYCRDITLNSDSSSTTTVSVVDDLASSSPSSSPSGIEDEEELELKEKTSKVGARVRVKVPLKVYHVPRVPEVDLTGIEGQIKQYVGLWKGKRISANFPYKVEFQLDNLEGRSGPVKFSAHLREDEFEFI